MEVTGTIGGAPGITGAEETEIEAGMESRERDVVT